jgi:hypothetical protein
MLTGLTNPIPLDKQVVENRTPALARHKEWILSNVEGGKSLNLTFISRSLNFTF